MKLCKWECFDVFGTLAEQMHAYIHYLNLNISDCYRCMLGNYREVKAKGIYREQERGKERGVTVLNIFYCYYDEDCTHKNTYNEKHHNIME